ncbi:hypothetical protein B5E65_01155 [Gemmiger sp. An120]|uniref:hypothetical protein n=1 Tax=Gemmiger TaxID=204475 RepID=UPI000B37B715|nr:MULTISPECIES: hypothetical protein [Gemmiger]MBM6916662.1 hypothetical protein [Gemmiger formicilis]OUQ44394.1 hypothetical protein B5E65_01155 [Gemmiger sp. An120]
MEILLDLLTEMAGLSGAPRWIRILAKGLLTLVFVLAAGTLTLYALVAQKPLALRLLAAGLAAALTAGYVFMLRTMRK